MSKGSGFIVEYEKEGGVKQRAVAIHSEQTSAFKNYDMFFLKLENPDGSPMMLNNRRLVSVKKMHLCTVIGFVD